MHLEELELLINNIKSGIEINEEIGFQDNINFFIDSEFEEKRKELYLHIMERDNLPSLAASKQYILKKIFLHYISTKLEEANILQSEHQGTTSKIIINNLSKLQKIFKSHDVINFPEFISQAEPNLSENEINLLFLKPTLSEDELEDIQNAMLKALGKKHIKLNNKDEFQLKFFNHPLMNCLTVYKNFDFIANQVQNDKFIFGEYEKLIKTLIKLNSKEMHEEYQGFISFLIREDLTIGFSKILKDDKYTPKYLRDLLHKITTGIELDDEAIKNLIFEIKNNHTKNIRLDSKQELVQNISSKHSLNDYGFEFMLDEIKLFLHGHETDNSGINQNNQQANTTLTLRNKSYDTIGMTILAHHATRDNENRCWVNADGFKGLLKLSPLEECLLTGLQFVSKYLLSMSFLPDISDLEKSTILNSNHHIVKSDIKTSQELINFKIGKSDLELIYEYKNAYLSIFKKNMNFFKVVLQTTSTDNQSQFQLIAEPFLNFIIGIKEIEEGSNISVFTEDDINELKNIINPILEGKVYNTSVGLLVRQASKALHLRNFDNNKTNEFNSLRKLMSFGPERLISNTISPSKDAENVKAIQKAIKKGNLEYVIKIIEQHPLSEKCSKTSKTAIAKNLELLIDKSTEKLLSINYNKNRVDRMSETITWYNKDDANENGITRTLLEGNDINFNLSSYSTGCWHEKVLSELLQDPKKENIILLKSFCALGELKEARIFCSNIPVKKKILEVELRKNKL